MSRKPSLFTPRQWLMLAAAFACAFAAALLAALPRDWIERAFGVEPDAGSGFFELLPVLVLALAAAILVTRVLLARRRAAAAS